MLATSRHMSPIYDFLGTSGFEPRVLLQLHIDTVLFVACSFLNGTAVSTILLGGFKAAQQRHSGSNCSGIYTHYSLC
jgi:hypothetical protein